MYVKFFGFKEPPFKLTPDPRFFFFSKRHQEAFSHILYGLKERKGFIAVTGEVGTGKTTLCRLLLDKIDPSVRTALLFNPQLSTVELLQSINQDFGLSGAGGSKKVLLNELNQFLLGLLAKGENALLIVDEAQLLTVECLEEIRLLSNLETDREKLIQILLIGQPELREKLNMKEMRQLKQRIALSYEIEPLGREEVGAYIEARLEVAGGKEKVQFSSKGIDQIYRYSRGFPRLINIAAEQALLAGYVANTSKISESIVNKAIDELKKGGAEDRGGAQKRLIGGLSAVALSLLLIAGLWGWKEGIFSPKPPASESVAPSILAPETTPTPTAPSPSAIPPSGEKGDSTGKKETPPAVAPPPVIPVPSSPPAVPSPEAVSPSDSSFDAEGIFRVDRISATEKGAILTLLNLWTPLKREENWNDKSVEEIQRWMGEKGIRSYVVPLDLNKILRLNYPVIFSSSDRGVLHYRVLAKVEDEEATLLDPLDGSKKVPLDQLSKQWKGKGVIFWSEIEGVHPPFREGTDQSIKKIQEILHQEGLFLAEADGIWGPRTRDAIRFFQQKEGLKEDGFFGVETHLFLAKRVNPETPALR